MSYRYLLSLLFIILRFLYGEKPLYTYTLLHFLLNMPQIIANIRNSSMVLVKNYNFLFQISM